MDEIIFFVVAVLSFALGCFSTVIFVRRTKFCTSPGDQGTLGTTKNLEIVSQDAVDGKPPKKTDPGVSRSNRNSSGVAVMTPPRDPRRASLQLSLSSLPSDPPGVPGVQVASTASEIANSLMLLSQNLPDDLKTTMLEIASQILYDRNLHNAVVEWNPGDNSDPMVTVDEDIKDWLAKDYSIRHTVSPLNTDSGQGTTPFSRKGTGQGTGESEGEHIGHHSHSKRASQLRFQAVPAGTPTSTSVSRRSSEPGMNQLQQTGSQNRSRPKEEFEDMVGVSNLLPQQASEELSKVGFQSTSTAEEIVSVLREIAEDLSWEKQLVMFDIANKILYNRNLHDAVVEWSSHASNNHNVDEEIKTWLAKDFLLKSAKGQEEKETPQRGHKSESIRMQTSSKPPTLDLDYAYDEGGEYNSPHSVTLATILAVKETLGKEAEDDARSSTSPKHIMTSFHSGKAIECVEDIQSSSNQEKSAENQKGSATGSAEEAADQEGSGGVGGIPNSESDCWRKALQRCDSSSTGSPTRSQRGSHGLEDQSLSQHTQRHSTAPSVLLDPSGLRGVRLNASSSRSPRSSAAPSVRRKGQTEDVSPGGTRPHRLSHPPEGRNFSPQGDNGSSNRSLALLDIQEGNHNEEEMNPHSEAGLSKPSAQGQEDRKQVDSGNLPRIVRFRPRTSSWQGPRLRSSSWQYSTSVSNQGGRVGLNRSTSDTSDRSMRSSNGGKGNLTPEGRLSRTAEGLLSRTGRLSASTDTIPSGPVPTDPQEWPELKVGTPGFLKVGHTTTDNILGNIMHSGQDVSSGKSKRPSKMNAWRYDDGTIAQLVRAAGGISEEERLNQEFEQFLDYLECPEIQEHVRFRDMYHFNMFNFVDVCDTPFVTLAFLIFRDHGVNITFNFSERELWDFLKAVNQGMLDSREVPFHNAIHVLDVLQTMHAFLIQCDIISWATSFEVYVLLLACTIHDYNHPGVNNAFLVNSQNMLAVLYNDMSVLENHHAASGFKLILTEHKALIDGMSLADSMRLRSMVISLIQNTDMKLHFNFLSEAQSRISHLRIQMLECNDDLKFFESLQEDDRMMLFKMLLKCADISNPTKSFEVYDKWTERVMEEFFRQGDREKRMGIEVSPMCDRVTTKVSKTQLGFIDFVVLPLFKTFAIVMPWVEWNVLPILASNKDVHKAEPEAREPVLTRQKQDLERIMYTQTHKEDSFLRRGRTGSIQQDLNHLAVEMPELLSEEDRRRTMGDFLTRRLQKSFNKKYGKSKQSSGQFKMAEV